MKILYIDSYIGTKKEENYPYYGGLYRALKIDNEVELYSKFFDNLKVLVDELAFNPNIIIFGLSYFEKFKYFDRIKNLDIPAIVYLFKPQNYYQKKLSFCIKNKVKHIITPLPSYKKIQEETNIPCSLMPYGFDKSIFKPRYVFKTYDLGFSGMLHQNKYYPKNAFKVDDLRKNIGLLLNQNPDIKVFWKGSDDITFGRISSLKKYAKTINNCKVWIATPAAFEDITPRYFEVMGSGTLLFCSLIPNEYNSILKNEVNCIEFKNDLSDFSEKLINILKNKVLRKKITNQARKDALENHTWDSRAQYFKKIVDTR